MSDCPAFAYVDAGAPARAFDFSFLKSAGEGARIHVSNRLECFPHIETRVKLQHNPYYYRRYLPHIQDSVPLFIRFNTHDRWELPGDARSLALESCLYEHGRRVCMHAVVIMPEHLHLLFSLMYSIEHAPPPLYSILKDIKGASAHSINYLLARKGCVWEAFDRATRANEFEYYLEYIRQNPVKRGLAASPEEYPWLWCNKS